VILLQVIAPQQFKTIPWKNGLGETTELAINDGGNLECFDWRLSIASVINDGVFSDFSGYQRNLVLIAGQGLVLEHDDKSSDNLANLLDIASFDGACQTFGKLSAGAIKDFNIITNKKKILPQVSCYITAQQVTVNMAKTILFFAFSLTGEMNVEVNFKNVKQEKSIVPQRHLLKISFADEAHDKDEYTFKISGENMILIQLQPNEADPR